MPDSRTTCEKQRSIHCEPQWVAQLTDETNGDELLPPQIIVPPDCPALLCTDTGLFNPLQCVNNTCFCVNVTTGVTIPATASDSDIFQCDYNGHVIRISEGNEGKCGEQDILQCDETEKWFRPNQCQSDYCFCVYVDSGGLIRGSEELVIEKALECPVLLDKRTGCIRERDEKCQVVVVEGKIIQGACPDTYCDEDGHYPTQRCQEEVDTCYCVDRITGESVPNTEFSAGTHYCSPSSELVPVPDCLQQSQLRCLPSGLFESTQCKGGSCWCVYSDSGKRVFDEFNTVEGCSPRNDTRGPCHKSRDALCQGADECLALTCSENGQYESLQCLKGDVCFCVDTAMGTMLSTARQVQSDVTCSNEGDIIEGAPCSTELCQSQTLCQRHNPADCNSESDSGHMGCSPAHSTQCTSDGFYLPHQCAGNVCYCVDVRTGAVFPDTATQNQEVFYCTTQGQVVGQLPCQEQAVYSCDSRGYFNSRQETQEGRFECVFIDSGKINFHDPDCRPVFDFRSACEKMRDETCPHHLDGRLRYIPDRKCETVQCNKTTGLFVPKQCRSGSCYCVDQITGERGSSPSTPDIEFTCSVLGELILLTTCRRQSQLKCGGDGSFAPDQFLEKVYFCVFTDSGAVVEERKSVMKPEECPALLDKRTRCQKARDEICPTMLSGIYFTRPNMCSALKCDVTSGLYSTTQCTREGLCYCVHPDTGEATSDPSAETHTFRCNAKGELVEPTPCQKQSTLQCTADGQFQPKQCFSPKSCYCVYNDTGVVVHDSNIISGDDKCPDTPDTRTHCQKNLDLRCPTKFNPETGLISRSEKCDAMKCTETGSYVTQHCFGPDSCYCIDSDSGVVLEDTLGPQDTFLCSVEGVKIVLTPCRRQDVLSCDARGDYNALQCGRGGVCSCVYIDTGYVIKGVGAEGCYARVDNRTVCQKRADSGCENESDCILPTCDDQGLSALINILS